MHRPAVILGVLLCLGATRVQAQAPTAIINGDEDSATTGALLDASVRGGVRLTRDVEAFLNLRYLGGGARGTSDDNEEEFGDGFTSNWISTATVSLGFSYRLDLLGE